MGLSVSLSAVGSSYKWGGLVARPGTLPGAIHLAALANGLNLLYRSCAGFVLLLTPTGGGSPHAAGAGGPGRRPPGRRCSWPRRPSARYRCTRTTRRSGAPSGSRPWPSPPLDALIRLAGVVVLLALVVAAATLAVAAAFQPARRRIQTWSTAATPNYPYRVRTVTPRTPTMAAADGRRARVRAGGAA